MRSLVQVLSFDVISKFLWGITGIALIRFMAELQFARYTLAMSLALIATQILGASFNRIYIIGHRRLRLTGPSSFLGFEVLVIAGGIAAALPLRRFTDGMYWYIVALVSANCLADLLRTIYQKELEFLRLSVFELGKAVSVSLAIIVLIGIRGHDLRSWEVLAAQAGIVLTVVLALLPRRVNWHELRDPGGALRVAGQVVGGDYRYLFAYFFLLAFFSQVDVVMLRVIAGNLELATYGAAFRYYTVLLLALSAVHVVLLPLVQGARTTSELARLFEKHRRTLGLFALSVALVAWGAQWLIPWVDGGRYPDAVVVFRILAASAIVSFAFSPHANLVMVTEDFRFLFGLMAVGLVLAVSLNALLIPSFGAVGAAFATLISFGVVNASISLRARRHMAVWPVQADDRGKLASGDTH